MNDLYENIKRYVIDNISRFDRGEDLSMLSNVASLRNNKFLRYTHTISENPTINIEVVYPNSKNTIGISLLTTFDKSKEVSIEEQDVLVDILAKQHLFQYIYLGYGVAVLSLNISKKDFTPDFMDGFCELTMEGELYDYFKNIDLHISDIEENKKKVYTD